MKRRTILKWSGAILASIFPACASADETMNRDLVGTWSGRLAIGSQGLRLRLEFLEDGKINLFSIDQGGAPINGRAKSLSNNQIDIEFVNIRARFTGSRNEDEIKGIFKQGPNNIAISFFRGADRGFSIPIITEALTKSGLEKILLEAQSPAIIAAAQMRGKTPISMVSGLRIANEANNKAQLEDRWHLGSISKSITCVLTARLIERGLLNWDTKIGEVLGRKIPQMNDEYKDATVLHLVSHQSGLDANIPLLKFLEFRNSKKPIMEARIDFATIALLQKPKGTKGQHFEYSNNGYVVLGAMLEQLSGRSWEELMATEVFGPLGMTNSGFGAPLQNQPQGHSKAILGDERKPAISGTKDVTDNPAVLGPAGTVHASAGDVLKYLAAHRDYHPILKPETWAILHKVHFGGQYACGLIRNSDGTLWHNGSNTLWYAEVSFNPETGVCGFACANDGYLPKSEPAVGKALNGIIAAAKA